MSPQGLAYWFPYGNIGSYSMGSRTIDTAHEIMPPYKKRFPEKYPETQENKNQV